MTPSSAVVAFVAVEHLAFLVLECFLFQTPIGLKVFRMSPAAAKASAVFAVNQGVYNGFLSAGLVWGLTAAPEAAPGIKTFFLCCAAAAGAVGGATAGRRLFFLQGAPALLGLALLRAGR